MAEKEKWELIEEMFEHQVPTSTVRLWECQVCAALVVERERHFDWHWS